MLKKWKNYVENLSKAIMWIISIAETKLNNRTTSSGHSTIGIIRLDAIGDFVLWSDTIGAYKEIYPDQRLILFCNSLYCELAQHYNEFDEIVPIEMKRYRKLKHLTFHMKTRSKLKKYKVDILLHPTYSRNVYMDSIAAAIPAHKKIAIDGETSNSSPLVKKINDTIYDSLVKSPPEAIMEMERNKAFVHGLGNLEYKSGYSSFPVLSSSYHIAEKYFVIYLGGSCINKYWPIERYAETAGWLYKKYGWKCCLLGTEAWLQQDFLRKIRFPQEMGIDLVGKTSLQDVAYIIQHAELLLGNDTSGVHFAVAVKTPSITIGGGWEYHRFLPYVADNPLIQQIQKTACRKLKCINCRYTQKIPECIRAEITGEAYQCISCITVDEVIQLIQEIKFKDSKYVG